MKRRMIWIAPLAIVGMVVFAFVGGEIVMHLWNWLLPPLFGWRQLTFWQALGMLVLCRILFGGFGGHGHGRSRMHHMSPEEKEQWRARMRERCEMKPASDPSAGALG